MWFLVAFLVGALLTLLMPTPKPTAPKGEDIKLQGVEQGKPQGILFGRAWIAPQIIHDGQTYRRPYKKKGGKK